MAKHWQTEILTTCALEYTCWENHYQPGIEEVDGTFAGSWSTIRVR